MLRDRICRKAVKPQNASCTPQTTQSENVVSLYPYNDKCYRDIGASETLSEPSGISKPSIRISFKPPACESHSKKQHVNAQSKNQEPASRDRIGGAWSEIISFQFTSFIRAAEKTRQVDAKCGGSPGNDRIAEQL
eukprot:501680_1